MTEAKPSSVPVILAIVGLLCVVGGCLAGGLSGWFYYQSQRSWDMGGLSSSEARGFARRLERESQERMEERVMPSGLGATCCLGIGLLLSVGGLFVGRENPSKGALIAAPAILAALLMFTGALVNAHGGWFSEHAEEISRVEDRLDDEQLDAMHESEYYAERNGPLRNRKLLSSFLCFGAFFSIAATGGLLWMRKKKNG